MTELRYGKRGHCSTCGNRTDLAWRGHYRNVKFTLDRKCFGRYSDVCRTIDRMLEEAA